MMYDLAVIGAGPGGYEAALYAASMGRAIALIEAQEVGGTCLNRGCIPTKAYLHGTKLCKPIADLAALSAQKNQAVETLRGGIERQLKKAGVTLVRGRGVISAAGLVEVGGDSLEAKNILIAVGSKPARPAIAGQDHSCVFTSDDLLKDVLPSFSRLTIVGGGVIGVEFATIYVNLGCQVTILEYAPRILPQMERELSQSVSMALKKQGVQIVTGAAVSAIDAAGAVTYTANGSDAVCEGDGVLLAAGRCARTNGLTSLDLRMERGFLPTNDRFETCVSGIYAIGDCRLGAIQLAHNATAEGLNAVAHMFGVEPPRELSLIPSCIYVNPEAASVGLTAEAPNTYSAKALTASSGKGVAVGAARGYVRLVFGADSHKLLGAQMVCDRATDMIGLLGALIQAGCTRETLLRTVFPHPTFSECIHTAAEAARPAG